MSAHKIAYLLREGSFPPVNGSDPVKMMKLEGYGYMFGYGTAVPSDAATGWAYGAWFVHVDGTGRADSIYVNEGDQTSCNFDSFTTPVAGDIALTTGSILLGTAGVAAELVAKTAGQILIGNGTTLVGLDAKGDGKILVGNGTTATSVAVSGDATLANTGALTIAALAVEEGMLAANAVSAGKLAAAVQDVIPYLTITGVDDTDTTGTASIQVKDAAGNNLAQRFRVRTWIGTADFGAPSAQTDFSVTTGVELAEVVANADYEAISDANGVVLMNIQLAAPGTVYVMAEVNGRIYSSGAIVITQA